MKVSHCCIGLLIGLSTLSTAVAYDFEYDAGDIEGSKTSTGITYTLSVSKGNLGTSYDFDTKEGVTSGSPSGIEISVSSGEAACTKEYLNDALPTSNFTISMNGKLIPPNGGSGDSQPTWGASGNAKAPFYIKSNQDGGAKNIVVPHGTNVKYSAYQGTSLQVSNWTVTGFPAKEADEIRFNKSFWVSLWPWSAPNVIDPEPGLYTISATAKSPATGSDNGAMTVVGVKSIFGEGKTSTRNSASEITNSETIWLKSISSGSVSLTAVVDPNRASWPTNTPEWDASCGFWCLLGDHFSGNTTGQTTVGVDTSTPDIITVYAQCGTSKKYIKIIAYNIDFTVSKDTLTLKHDNDVKFEITVEPSFAFSGNAEPVIQIKRTGTGATDWLELLKDTGTINWKARVAGVFKLRVKTKVNEIDYTTPEKDLTVNFPTYSQIIADSTVSERMNSEWQATLNDCTFSPNRFRERGFWIAIDTASNKYVIVPLAPGAWSNFATRASISLGARPGKNLSEVPIISNGVQYAVAFFHTHPPMTYAPNNTYFRDTGMSQEDKDTAKTANCVGIVYDYIENPIIGLHTKDAPAKLHNYNTQRKLDQQ